MANWCMNHFQLTLGKERSAVDLSRIERWLRVAQHRGERKRLGLPIFGNFIFNIEIFETDEESIAGRYETQWNPLHIETYLLFALAFPSVQSMSISFEEPDMGVYGSYVLEDGTIKGYTVPPSFLVLQSMREFSDNGYDSLENAAERTGRTIEEIKEALTLAQKELKDFNEDMEPFDYEDYLILES